MNGFDYELLEPIPCEYEVRQPQPNDDGDCGDPSIARVWWEEDGKDSMHVCQTHFTIIKNSEDNL